MRVSLAVSTKVHEIGPPAARPPEGPQYETTEGNLRQNATKISEAKIAVVTSPAEKFAEEQVHGLIQRVFFPGWPKVSRQVVISGADEQANTVGVCARIVREMAAGLPGTVCAVEADRHRPGLAERLGACVRQPAERESSACIRVDENLWLEEPESLCSTENDGFNSVCLRTRMSELRRNFDYTLIHAPAALLTQTIVLGQLADGLVLVIQAGKTHKAVAQTALTTLKVAKVTVLGTVLMDRTFPIPEKLYKRL